MKHEDKNVKGEKAMINEKYVRFDWAMKRMLRDKANFDVLEGLMTVLFEQEVKIVELLESEANQETEDDKYNRVDLKAKDSRGEIILVEIQLNRDIDYLKRIVYGVAKTITDHMSLGKTYKNVKKVYSVSIVYFNFGEGKDYLYHGQTQLKGVFKGDTLQIRPGTSDLVKIPQPKDVFPEYYFIRVNEFNELARTPLGEWLEYLKSGHIKDDTTVPGLQAAREKLQYIRMSPEERLAYEHHLDSVRSMNGVINTALLEGMEKGMEEGIEKGRAEGRAEGREERSAEIARSLKKMGLPTADIAAATGLTVEDIAVL